MSGGLAVAAAFFGLAVLLVLIGVVRGFRNHRLHLAVWDRRNRPEPVDFEAELRKRGPLVREVPSTPWGELPTAATTGPRGVAHRPPAHRLVALDQRTMAPCLATPASPPKARGYGGPLRRGRLMFRTGPHPHSISNRGLRPHGIRLLTSQRREQELAARRDTAPLGNCRRVER